jgi:hypothetical protein
MGNEHRVRTQGVIIDFQNKTVLGLNPIRPRPFTVRIVGIDETTIDFQGILTLARPS